MSKKQSLKEILSVRELEICDPISKGLSNDEIAKQLHISEGTVKNHITDIFGKTGARNRAEIAVRYALEYGQSDTEIVDQPELGKTEFPDFFIDARLRLVGFNGLPGLNGLPDTILLRLQGRPFIIGRYDVRVGHKQQDFEFPKETKAVSRRHASIERTARGYLITDLDSKVGTFINGTRITPGERYLIQTGDRVSFGSAGADYIFED